jgi:hypothetical protein
MPIGLWDVEAPTFSRQSAHRWRWGCQPYALATLYNRLSQPQSHSAAERIRSIEKSNDLIGDRTRYFPACTIVQRCTSHAQRTVCDDVCCCAVHACTGWNGPAGHVAGEWRAASAIAGEGERTQSERDRWFACYGMVGGAGSTQPVRTLAQCTARVQESCARLP